MRDACPSYTPLMTEALFGELPDADRDRLDAHLETCPACAAEFASLQSTLNLTAQHEHPERPDAYWDAFSEQLHDRIAAESASASGASAPSWTHRLSTWWALVANTLPGGGSPWVLQLGFATVLVVAGLVLGRATAPSIAPRSGDLATTLTEAAGPATDPLLTPIGDAGTPSQARPRLMRVDDIVYTTDGDAGSPTVEIRYHTSSDVVVRGAPDDPRIQTLLRAALLDESNPSSRLHAVKTLEASATTPNDEIVRALTYLARDEEAPDMRLRAVRALNRLHENTPLNDATRGVLVDVLLHARQPALRIEAMTALTNDAARRPGDAPSFLYEAQSDTNGYVRYRAREVLQQIESDNS